MIREDTETLKREKDDLKKKVQKKLFESGNNKLKSKTEHESLKKEEAEIKFRRKQISDENGNGKNLSLIHSNSYDSISSEVDEETHPFDSLKLKINELKSDLSDIKLNDTAEFEKIKAKEIEKKDEETRKKKKIEERISELSIIREETESLKREKDDLKKQIQKKLFESEINKLKSKTELESLKKEEAEITFRQKQISDLFLLLKQAEKVDLCFMVDCTGSMDSFINEVKVVIHRIFQRLSKVFKDFSLRASFVGYRDIEDGNDRTTVFQFDHDADNFKRFVNELKAKGGHDACEDVFGGLEEVTKLDWRNPTRVLFHIADAPCHGKRFHNGCYDSHPSGDPRGLDLTNLLRFIVENQINYYFAEINGTTFKMIDEFNKELSMLSGNEIKSCSLKNVKDLEMLATNSITNSISQTISTSKHSVGSGKSIKKIVIDKKALKWSSSDFKSQKAEFYLANLSGDISNLKSMKINFKPENIEIQLCQTPFAKGSIRYAYAAFLNVNGKQKKCVLKESIYQNIEANSMSYYKDMIESQMIAIYLADIFSKLSRSTKTIKFLDVNLLMLKESSKYFSVEEFLDGEFIKFNNNGGLVNEDNFSITLNAFSHWTYQATNEYLLISDLQGFIFNKDQYILTDPAIICPEDLKKFGPTNMGQKGIKAFFSNHQCNPMCKSLKLKKHKYQVKELPDKQSKLGTEIKS